ncbi:ATP-binding cassette transporter yor1, partial [Coemansia guatemalensis]
MMLVQATQMGSYATYAGRGWSELQNNMNSVERINYYATSLAQEPDDQSNQYPIQDGTNLAPISMRSPSRSWPERGTIIIRGLSVRYRPGLPLALDGVDMEVYDGEKIGIVGRSGAGKSSIVSAIFRLTEPSGGKVFIDGVDTQMLPLERLRKSIGLLPQDPVLFEGTLRTNLDPYHEFSDSDIWDHLRLVNLYNLAAQHPEKLDMLIQEGGENLS